MTLKKLGKLYDSRLEEEYHSANPHLIYHPQQILKWMSPTHWKSLKEVMSTADQMAVMAAMCNSYYPDFRDPTTGTLIETKGYPLSSSDRTKYRAIVEQNPQESLKFVIQVRPNQITSELTALLAARNQLLMSGLSTDITLVTKQCRTLVKDLMKHKGPQKRTTSGLSSLYWVLSLRVQVDVFSVRPHKRAVLPGDL